MPSSASGSLLLFGIVLALVDADTAAVVSGAAGVAWEAVLVYIAGRT